METSNKSPLSERQIVLIIAAMVTAALFFCGWSLGIQRADKKYQAEIASLKTENYQLAEEMDAWKEKAEIPHSVSAKTALKALYAEYPKNSQLVAIEYPFSDCARFSYFQMLDEWKIPFPE